MKEWGLLIWIPQFAISVFSPLIIFLMLAVWLHNNHGWGAWVIWAGLFFGLFTAGIGFRDSLRAMLQMTGGNQKSPEPGISFNEHK